MTCHQCGPDTTCRLFADGCYVVQRDPQPIKMTNYSYRVISNPWKIGAYSGAWSSMRRSAILSISRSETPRKRFTINDTVLGEVSCSTYLGVLLTTDITWASHISIYAKKANSRLGFIKCVTRKPVHNPWNNYKLLIYHWCAPLWNIVVWFGIHTWRETKMHLNEFSDVLPGGWICSRSVPVSPVCSVHLVSNHLNSDEKLPDLLWCIRY